MYIVVADDIIMGFDFFGPFSNVKDADDFVSSYLGVLGRAGQVVRLCPARHVDIVPSDPVR